MIHWGYIREHHFLKIFKYLTSSILNSTHQSGQCVKTPTRIFCQTSTSAQVQSELDSLDITLQFLHMGAENKDASSLRGSAGLSDVTAETSGRKSSCSPDVYLELYVFSWWDSVSSRSACCCSSAPQTTATFGPIPSTRSTVWQGRWSPPTARRRLWVVRKSWRSLCFQKTTCLPGNTGNGDFSWFFNCPFFDW